MSQQIKHTTNFSVLPGDGVTCSWSSALSQRCSSGTGYLALAPISPIVVLRRLLVALVAVLTIASTTPSLAQPKTAASDTSAAVQEPKVEDSNNEEVQEEINVRNADIAAILRIFSRKTKRNYLLDERVRGKVSMYLPGKLSADDSQRILDSVLALKGFAAVPIGDNLWKVIPAREAKQATIPTLGLPQVAPGGVAATAEEPLPVAPQADSTVITKLIPLKHSSVEEVQPILSQLVSPDGLISQFSSTNTLVIIDYEDNVVRLARIVNSLDIPFDDSELVIIPIKYADAVDISQKLTELLGTSQGPSQTATASRARARAANPGQPPGQGLTQMGNRPPSGNNPNQATGSMERRSQEPKILPDERTNSVIVVADENTTARIRALVAQLDSKVDLSTNRFYVYRCQHAEATEIAQVLSGLVGGGGAGGIGGDGAGRNSRTSLSSQGGLGMNDGFGGGGGGGLGTGGSSRLQGTQRRPGTPFNQGQGRAGPTSVQLGENLAVTADPDTNSLIISASKGDYEKLLSLIQRLDIKRRQVLVEAMILEVSVDDSRTLGADFITSTGGADGAAMAISNLGGDQGLAGLLSNPTQISGFAAAAASSGTIKLPNDTILPSQAILISAAQSNQNVNVLSAPTLLTTDNEEAQIVVGQNVPFLTGTGTNNVNLNNTFNQIERQDVGITLRITPQISSNNFVTLRIFTDVSAVIPTADTSLGPTTTVRSSETTVITRDGQMIVTGGLIADRSNDSTSGVPFFQDIPFLGHFFRRTTDERRRTNLLTFLTPRIVADQFDARDTTIEHRDRLKYEMQIDGQFPNRSEVLENPRIDEVTEIKPPPEQGPGTILPPTTSGRALTSPSRFNKSVGGNTATPAKTIDRSQDATLKRESAGDSLAPATTSSGALIDEGEISISIAPELPNALHQDQPTEPEVKGRLLPSTTNSASQPRAYALLRVNSGSGDKSGLLPFPISDEGLVAIKIPETTPEQRKLFIEGEKYSYEIEGGKVVELSSVGTFSSAAEASALAKNTALIWYELSPAEIIRFGDGPWRRR